MSGDPKRFGSFAAASSPDRDEPVVPRGRPNWCGGALIRDGLGGKERRIACDGIVEPGFGLCARCSELEAENRRSLRAEAESKKSERGGRRRVFGEDAK